MFPWTMHQYLKAGRYFSELRLQAEIHGFINAIILTQI